MTSDIVRLSSGFPNIVLIGKMHAGKSEIRNFLEEFVGGYQHVSFAKEVKETAKRLFVDPGRSEYQKLGMAVREIDPDAWLRIGVEHAELINRLDRPFVCDDCRFPNELEALCSLPNRAVVIEVYAERGVRLQRLKMTGRFEDESQLDDDSETALDEWERVLDFMSHTIDNSHITKVELMEKVGEIIDNERRK